MSGENKKVKNAKAVEFNGIVFKSKLELNCYKKLFEAGFNPAYESDKFLLQDGFRLENTKYYSPLKRRNKVKIFGLNNRFIMSMTYTPDFYFKHKDYDVFFDTKGAPNDTYPIKKKLFFKILEDTAKANGSKFMFFEPHNAHEIDASIEILLNTE